MFFFFKQNTAYDLRISDWSSDVCPSDLDGVGLPRERDRITEPYVTTRMRGTGLGLAIVKKIVEEHFGSLEFLDRPGGGTIARMTFDMHLLAAARDEPDPTNEDRKSTRLNPSH